MIFFAGWPKIKILALPLKDMYPIIIFSLNGFILPILVSCVIYLVLICHTKKHFEQSVSVAASKEVRANQTDTQSKCGHFNTG